MAGNDGPQQDPKLWPAEYWPAPRGGYRDRRVEVFWDMQNCKLDRAYTPQQHFSLLSNIFVQELSAHHDRFYIHAFLPIDDLVLLQPAIRIDLCRLNQDVCLRHPLGHYDEFCKELQHGLDIHMITAMRRFIEQAVESDVMVVIAGDGDYLDTIRHAANRGITVLLLSQARATSPTFNHSGAIAWSAHWTVPALNNTTFIAYHAHRLFGSLQASTAAKSPALPQAAARFSRMKRRAVTADCLDQVQPPAPKQPAYLKVRTKGGAAAAAPAGPEGKLHGALLPPLLHRPMAQDGADGNTKEASDGMGEGQPDLAHAPRPPASRTPHSSPPQTTTPPSMPHQPLHLLPQPAAALFAQGVSLLEAERFRDAMEVLQQAAQYAVRDPCLHSDCLWYMSRLARAMRDEASCADLVAEAIAIRATCTTADLEAEQAELLPPVHNGDALVSIPKAQAAAATAAFGSARAQLCKLSESAAADDPANEIHCARLRVAAAEAAVQLQLFFEGSDYAASALRVLRRDMGALRSSQQAARGKEMVAETVALARTQPGAVPAAHLQMALRAHHVSGIFAGAEKSELLGLLLAAVDEQDGAA